MRDRVTIDEVRQQSEVRVFGEDVAPDDHIVPTKPNVVSVPGSVRELSEDEHRLRRRPSRPRDQVAEADQLSPILVPQSMAQRPECGLKGEDARTAKELLLLVALLEPVVRNARTQVMNLVPLPVHAFELMLARIERKASTRSISGSEL